MNNFKYILIAFLFLLLTSCSDDVVDFLEEAEHPVILIAKNDHHNIILLMDAKGNYFSDDYDTGDVASVSTPAIIQSYEPGDTIPSTLIKHTIKLIDK